MKRPLIALLLLCVALTFIGCKPQQSSDQPGEGTGGNSFVELGSGSSPLKPAPKVRSITVSPSSTAVPVGRTVQFTAKGVHKDGTTVDLTDSVTWTSSDTSIATVSGTGLGTGVAVGGPVTLTATFEKMSGTARLIVTDAVLSSIAITPAVESVPAGMTQQFTASGIYSNGTTIDVTDSVTWTSSDTSIATVDGTGLGKGVRVGGHVTLTATLGNVSGTAQLTVTQAVLTAIALTPATASVPAGMTQQFTANGSYSDGTTVDITNNVTWTSSNTSIATVSDRGVGNGAAPGGPVTVTATLGGMSGTSQLDVTRAVLTAIAVTPATASVPAGMTQQFTANGSYSDGTTVDITNTVTWTSGDTSLATVDGTGLGIGVAAGGPVTLTATLDDVSGSSQLTVTQAVLTSIAITPAAASVPVGLTQQLTASGSYSNGTTRDITDSVMWTSSNTAVATVNDLGLATGVSVGGPVTVTATVGNVSGSLQIAVTEAVLTSITVTPGTASVPAGMTQSFTSTGRYSDGTTRDVTTSVTWTSSDTAIATVDGAGLGTGGAAGGPVTVTATLGNVSGTSQFTVTRAVLTAIAVTPAMASVPVGMTKQFNANGSYSDGTTVDITDSVTWTSSDTSVATVDGAGLGTGMTVGGPVTLTATLGSVSGASQLSVTQAVLASISVSPATASVPAGLTKSFTAQGRYSDGSTMDVTNKVTWTSSNTGVARVSDTGVATGVVWSGEPITLTATMGNVKGTARLTVTFPLLSWIMVAPSNITVLVGRTQILVAYGKYTDGGFHDITALVTWTSSNNSVATLGRGASVTGVASGSVTITATRDDVVGTSLLTFTRWSSAGNMTSGREEHTATLLPSGKVLVAGGSSHTDILAAAELYDPATNTWSPAGSMTSPRKGHVATLLRSGQVLVVGGNDGSSALSSMEVYDPATNTWSPAGSMPSDRRDFTVTTLPSGKLLVLGGYNGGNSYPANAELYDPATNTWSSAGSMTSGRGDYTVTLLSSGKVLVAGGYGGRILATAELYDPDTNTWSSAGSMGTGRHLHSATLLSSGKVLVVGSANGGGSNPLATAELYDPDTNTWSPVASMAVGRYGPTLTLLSSGKVLAAGGFMGTVPAATAELYDPASNTWSAAGSMAWSRIGHTATLLGSGQVLAVGGYSQSGGILRQTELYLP